jgi:hypothetical protein
MNDGKISNNTASSSSSSSSSSSGGGGVHLASGAFTMNDGEISYNSSSSASGGGGVLASGTFRMNGGEVSYNSAGNTGTGNAYGGGVYSFYSSSSQVFTMSGGEISGNYVNGGSGGGVYANGTFKKTGGLIKGDTDTGHALNDPENTASSGTGHAVLHSNGLKRNSDAGPGQNLDSSLAGSGSGWE